MAKENYVSLRGQLRKEVKYFVDPTTGDVKNAIFQLTVMRRDIRDRANNFSPKYDKPLISTTDADVIRQIQKLNVGDIVEVKGFYKTKYVTKRCSCPRCATVNAFDTNFPTVVPLYVGKCVELSTTTEGTDYMKNCAEISNIVKIIGRLCIDKEDIVYAETDRGDRYAKYKIAVNRKYFDQTAVDEEDHTDYPVVYSYNEVADQDMAMMKKGTLIYLDGYLHTMKYDADVVCCECGEKFTVSMQRMNLTPYSNEYLRDHIEDGLESTHTKETMNEPEIEHDSDIE